MKYKTMNKVINKKFDDWVETIEDYDVKELVKENTIITGGCITSMILKEKINDFDVYFTNLETTFAVAKYYADKMEKTSKTTIEPQIVSLVDIDGVSDWRPIELKDNQIKEYEPNINEDVEYRVRCFIRSKGVVGDETQQYDEEVENDDILVQFEENEKIAKSEELDENNDEIINKKYRPVYITSNAITLSNKIQIVIRFYGQPDVIHSNYDFVHVTNYWTSKDKVIVDNINAYRSIIAKELQYVGSRYPLASIIRMKKFVGRGWTCNAGQIVKMAMQLNELNLENPRVIEEQLTGVDVAYFHNIISTLKKKANEEDNFDVKSYLLDVINKIFD